MTAHDNALPAPIGRDLAPPHRKIAWHSSVGQWILSSGWSRWIIARFFTGSPFEPFRQEIILDRQPPDLGVQIFDFGAGMVAPLAARKYIRHPVDGVTLPCADLVRLQLVSCHDRSHDLIAAQRYLRLLGLELIREGPAPRHARIPSKGSDTPWPAVWFSGTT